MSHNSFSRRDFLVAAGSVAATVNNTEVRPASRAAQGNKPAILGGTPVRTARFPEWPSIESADEELFLDSLRRKEWCRLYGDITTSFEKKWAQMLGANHVTGVVNGTNALYAALNALDVNPGDEVIVPPFTFVATVNAVIQQFALPVFVDTDPNTFQIDPSSLEDAITENTKAILPVHMGGNMAHMEKILAISSRAGVPVVEDACQAHFAEWQGKRAGTLGDIGCFSFQASKILPCGEGGAIVTNNEKYLDSFHAFQNNGRDRISGTRNGYLHQGTNLRMTEFQGALLLAQLKRFEEICARREKNAAHLTELLEEIPGIAPAAMYEGCTRNTYYLYMLRYDESKFAGLSRREFLRALGREGIPAGSGYRPLYNEPFLRSTFSSRGYQRLFSKDRMKEYWTHTDFPGNEEASKISIFLSQTCLLETRQGVEQVAEAIARVQKHAGEIKKALANA